MQIITAGKVALTSGAALQVSALSGIAASIATDGTHFVRQLVIRASDTQTGTVYVGPSTVTSSGTNAFGAVLKSASASGQSDFLDINGGGENEVDLNAVWVISASATDTVYVYAFVE